MAMVGIPAAAQQTVTNVVQDKLSGAIDPTMANAITSAQNMVQNAQGAATNMTQIPPPPISVPSLPSGIGNVISGPMSSINQMSPVGTPVDVASIGGAATNMSQQDLQNVPGTLVASGQQVVPATPATPCPGSASSSSPLQGALPIPESVGNLASTVSAGGPVSAISGAASGAVAAAQGAAASASGAISAAQGAVSGAVGAAQGAVSGAVGAVKGVVAAAQGPVGSAISAARGAVSSVQGAVNNIQGIVSNAVSTAQGLVTTAVGTAQGVVGELVGTVQSTARQALSEIIPQGGLLNVDSVPWQGTQWQNPDLQGLDKSEFEFKYLGATRTDLPPTGNNWNFNYLGARRID